MAAWGALVRRQRAHRRAIADADAAPRLPHHVPVVAVRAIRKRNAGRGIGPGKLAAGAAMAECQWAVRVAETALSALVITGDHHAEGTIHWCAHGVGEVLAHLQRMLQRVRAPHLRAIVCAVGWSLALGGLLKAPGLDATDAEIVAYYADHRNTRAAVIWLQVLVVATIAFLWFVGVVRGRLGDREPRLFGAVFFGASLLLAGLLFFGAALIAAPAALVEITGKAPRPDAVSLLRATAAVVLSVFAPRIATLVMLSTASLGRVTRALPRWLVWLTFAIGIAAFINVSINTPSIYVVPGWIAVVSIVLLVRRPPNGFTLPAADPPAA